MKKYKMLEILMIIPVITAVLALTSQWHNLFITVGDASTIYYNPVREVTENYHF